MFNKDEAVIMVGNFADVTTKEQVRDPKKERTAVPLRPYNPVHLLV